MNYFLMLILVLWQHFVFLCVSSTLFRMNLVVVVHRMLCSCTAYDAHVHVLVCVIKKWITRKEAFPIATLSIRNLTSPDLRSNPVLRVYKPISERPNHGHGLWRPTFFLNLVRNFLTDWKAHKIIVLYYVRASGIHSYHWVLKGCTWSSSGISFSQNCATYQNHVTEIITQTTCFSPVNRFKPKCKQTHTYSVIYRTAKPTS